MYIYSPVFLDNNTHLILVDFLFLSYNGCYKCAQFFAFSIKKIWLCAKYCVFFLFSDHSYNSFIQIVSVPNFGAHKLLATVLGAMY